MRSLHIAVLVGIVLLSASLVLRQDALLAAHNCFAPHYESSGTFEEPPLSKSKPSYNEFNEWNPKDYNGPFTIYKVWNKPFPCVPAEKRWRTVSVQRSPAREGLLYLREMKTGSSTLAGVVLHIAQRHAKKVFQDTSENVVMCNVRIDHSSARDLEYSKRNKERSFLLSLLRDPTQRIISAFFHFRVSQSNVVPKDENFQNFIRKSKSFMCNYYVRDLGFRPDMEEQLQQNRTTYDDLIQEILNEYDFIGITERMDESLVVLKMLLGLELTDILYMSAKTRGSFTPSDTEQRPCVYIVPSFLTPGMEEFFRSEYWKQYIAADMALYRAAYASLDRTIDSLGRVEFQAQLAEFQRALHEAHSKCATRTVYRCNARGDHVGSNSTCVMWDIGCGNKCLDDLAANRFK